MSKTKKFYITNNTERFLSFLASLAIILCLNIILANTLLKKIKENAEASFIRNCGDQVETYAIAVDNKLDQLEDRLNRVYAKLAYKELTIREIRAFLKEAKSEIHEPFGTIAFADLNGNSWNMNDEYFSVTDRYYFHRIIDEKAEFYVTNVLEAKHDGSSSVIFARPVYDSSYEIKGVLFATCPVEELASYLADIKIAQNYNFIIRDSNNRIISHYNKKWNGWTYSPWKFRYTVLKTPEKGYQVIDSVNAEGKAVYVFFKDIGITKWTIGYSVPKEEFENIKKTHNSYHTFIIEIIIIVLSITFLLEIWIHKMLERHQILTTHIDSLTHLWSQEYFEKEANKLIKRHSNSRFLMIVTDIRGFKFINQNYGETQANRLLLTFSKMLYETSYSFNAILCRGYADHFFILFRISSVHKAMHMFKEGLKDIDEKAKKNELPFIPKFGLSFYLPNLKDDIQGIHTLISRAIFAKSTIKENALQQFAIYDEKLLIKSKNENFIETHMETALANKEFFVLYQPKIDLSTDRVVGAEALVRWKSTELGYMPPNSFVPLFERNNFIVKLDFFVYEQVFKFIRKCMDNNEPTVPISVNVSRNHDKPEKFVRDFTNLLKKYDISPTMVEVELLERATLDKNLLRDITIMLQKEGFKVAMDDFGSGESSLNMLSSIPVNILKFDRSFLFANDAQTGKLDETTETFISTLVGLGKNLKKETIFEGVETEEQRDFLKKIHCDQVQGYFYSKPLREDEFMAFLKKHV